MLSLTDAFERAREVAQDVVARQADGIDQEARWPESGIRALQEAGLGGLVVPTSAGGSGGGLYALARICEVLGQVCPSTALCYGMHAVGAAVISAKATPDQVEQYLRPIAAGTHLTTLALSEPGTGAHFYIPQVELSHNGDSGYMLNGTKSFVTNGGHADSYVVSTCTSDDQLPLGEFSMVVVPATSPGLHWQETWHGFGMRGNSSRTVELRQVPVSASNLLGASGDQIWYIFSVVAPYFLMAMAGTYLGIATAAINEAQQHLTRRRYSHTGAELAQQSVIQHRFGTLWAAVERTRQFIYYAAEGGDAGDPGALSAILSAKAEVADCAVQVTNEAMTLCGGIAYREYSRLSRLLRDARAAHVMSPTTDLLRTWTGRSLLGQPLLGD